MKQLAAFGRFWWDFVIGDDWLVAAPRPASADRQPRASPAARTIVSASTISTALARNAERTRKVLPVLMSRASSGPRPRHSRPLWRRRPDRCAAP